MNELRSPFKTLMIGLSLLTCGCSQNTIDERGPSREGSNTTLAQRDRPVGVDRRLYNGILLPEKWPPDYGEISRDPMPVPYLTDPPAVIPIDVGRQLFVDDFLIETTTLSRTFHQAEYCAENPVIRCDKPGDYLTPFSGGAWYDPADNLFKIWYSGGENTLLYATSKDGWIIGPRIRRRSSSILPAKIFILKTMKSAGSTPIAAVPTGFIGRSQRRSEPGFGATAQPPSIIRSGTCGYSANERRMTRGGGLDPTSKGRTSET